MKASSLSMIFVWLSQFLSQMIGQNLVLVWDTKTVLPSLSWSILDLRMKIFAPLGSSKIMLFTWTLSNSLILKKLEKPNNDESNMKKACWAAVEIEKVFD